MRIALDVMGGDQGCAVAIDGVRLALKASSDIAEIFVVGRQDEVERAITRARLNDSRVRIVHASEVLTMEDNPLSAIRKKKDSSMARGIELIKTGQADALISAGNTGALIAASTLALRRLEGVERPAIAAVMPSGRGEFILIDAGANPDCKPSHLVQFAIMGNIYSREILGHKRPRVGILSNGTEPMKGTDCTREAYQMCQRLDLHFIGYVEGHDLFSDHVDVVVTDGFLGNVVLKTSESLGKTMLRMLRRELAANPVRKLGATLAARGFQNLKRKIDPDVYGGAPILGLHGTVIKAHGSAREQAFMNAIRVSTQAVRHHINDLIRQDIARSNIAEETPVPA
jgi:glycerol-3-phosphate acyltransferase PlsX